MCDHVTRVRYFQIYYVAIIVDTYNISTFFWQEFSAIYNTLFATFPFNLFALNLEFEPNTRRELFLIGIISRHTGHLKGVIHKICVRVNVSKFWPSLLCL